MNAEEKEQAVRLAIVTAKDGMFRRTPASVTAEAEQVQFTDAELWRIRQGEAESEAIVSAATELRRKRQQRETTFDELEALRRKEKELEAQFAADLVAEQRAWFIMQAALGRRPA